MSARPSPAPFEGLLAEAGRLLAASLDLDDTLRTVARLAVPEFADWAAVDFVRLDGTIHQISSGHEDPAKDAFLLELRRRHRRIAAERQERPAGALEVLHTGAPMTFAPVPVEQLPTETPEEDALWAEIGAVSWLVVPLRTADDRVVGALTFLSTVPGRVYDEGDIPIAAELADRCGQALRNAQLYDEARSGRVLLDTVFAAAPVGIALLDAELRPVLRNARMDDFAVDPDAILATRVLTSGLTVSDVEATSGARTFSASYAPVEVDGRVLGVVIAMAETTERERLLDRASRLQAVTERLSAALTEDEVAEVIVRQAMDATGARCGVLGLMGAEPAAVSVRHRFGIDDGPPSSLPLELDAPIPVAARTGAPVLVASRAEWLQQFPQLPPRGEFEAFAAVPLLFEDSVRGVMGIGYPDERQFAAGDVEMLTAIGRQGAQALERARLYEERAYVARTLQEGLLPRALPAVDGLELAVRYRPIGDGSEVGGDFYDVVPLNDGTWLATVGDICGKGTGAAVLTGVMRSTIRALALHVTDLEPMVSAVNEALLREGSAQALATLGCATLRREGDAVEACVAAGGHPPALILRADGAVEVVDATGPMLGVRSDPELHLAQERLEPGDLLLLYTDGVIDARRDGVPPFGEARLREALAAGAGLDAPGVLDTIDSAVRAYAPGPPRDDKALLAIRAAP